MLAALSAAHAFAGGPLENPLLPLVPSNAEIVAGIEDPHHGDTSGRLLIVTHNDNVDLQDWLALAGADDRQQVDTIIEVAASSPRGELSEHLLLIRGSFSGRRILETAEDNGAKGDHYDGLRVAEVKPFARELKEMQDTRWLSILDDNTVVFGTPVLVKTALDRYVTGSPVSPELTQRLRGLKQDVNCWSILTMPGSVMKTHLPPGVLDQADAALVERITSTSVAIHYGSQPRLDFVLGADNAQAATALETAISGPAYLLRATDPPRVHLRNISVQGNEVRGSVAVSGEGWDTELANLYARASDERRSQSNIAQVRR